MARERTTAGEALTQARPKSRAARAARLGTSTALANERSGFIRRVRAPPAPRRL
jgi:hypothetical protein